MNTSLQGYRQQLQRKCWVSEKGREATPGSRTPLGAATTRTLLKSLSPTQTAFSKQATNIQAKPRSFREVDPCLTVRWEDPLPGSLPSLAELLAEQPAGWQAVPGGCSLLQAPPALPKASPRRSRPHLCARPTGRLLSPGLAGVPRQEQFAMAREPLASSGMHSGGSTHTCRVPRARVVSPQPVCASGTLPVRLAQPSGSGGNRHRKHSRRTHRSQSRRLD